MLEVVLVRASATSRRIRSVRLTFNPRMRNTARLHAVGHLGKVSKTATRRRYADCGLRGAGGAVRLRLPAS